MIVDVYNREDSHIMLPQDTVDTIHAFPDGVDAVSTGVAQWDKEQLDIPPTDQQMKEQAVDSRLAQWDAAVRSELQELLTMASELQKEVSGAKTQTKRAYFKRKLDKLKPQIFQMMAALQKINTQADGTVIS